MSDTENTQAVPEVAPEVQEAPKAPEQAKPEIDYSTRFAALTRKERELQQREQKYKKELEELRSKLNPYQEFESKKSLAKENPEILDELLSKSFGMSFEDILNLKLSSDTVEKKQRTPEDVYNELMAKMEADKKAAQELELKKQQENDEKALAEFKNNIQSYAQKAADKFELLNYIGDYESVFTLIEQHHEATGEIMEIADACAAMENHYEQLLEGAAKFNKIKSKFSPAPQEVKAEPKAEAQLEKLLEAKVSAPKTLSNSLQSQGVSSADSSKILDPEESKRKAAALLRWS